ncbi:hypothetical protein A3A71_01915 [Candidatus Berkelbacteria bacterium RIFCSPLOWO2_01_FULL_50_28]|uniref:Type II secretion system protein GspF domain-containing protein n=1 Tax=Candidatus Berkelbacteria bacterium RIFCSPLOWO2_01_FULL_50_28 TaxID=1797471 RepID=A0A1F5EBQ5_9BACT|nr:MAG: hypothetical protein A3F39_00120 [Candidatus Berkelbacteria bacterium RIFCSPHIGHO2_12_FULL_50_11]OGD64781.1 MAG: hypothetical protein A3A71_01915 [Candidatus Berkelbacteria bacterium RIFCSPLOWO2_01_FULL_50_28]
MATTYDFYSAVFRRVSTKERSFASRQLAVMLESGLPISQAVRSLTEQTSNPTLQAVMSQILTDLENGYKFSDAIKKHPKVFNGVYTSVIAAGEATGKLDVTMNLMADEQERDLGFTRRIIGALLYPAFIVAAMIVVGIVMVTKIVPALEQVFTESNAVLPWTTRTVVAITNSLINYWWVYIGVIAVLVFLVARYLASNEGRRSFNAVLLKVPVFGTLIRNLEMARFTRILGMMMQAGVPIIQAIDSVSQVMENELYKEALAQVARNVERGAPISQSLVRDKMFPTIVTQMVAVGEQTGRLEAVLQKLASYYEEETNQSIKNITALVEPVVFVIVGLGVAFLVFSIIVPIYGIANIIN